MPQVRLASSSDAESLERLINSAFVVERIAFDGDRVDLQGIRLLMAKGSFLILENAGSQDFAACVYLEPRGDRCYLGLLSVAPRRQGQGLARVLETASVQFARHAGCHAMDLRVISPLAGMLVPIYKRLGYVETGTAPLAAAEVAPKVPCHYILMEKSLR